MQPKLNLGGGYNGSNNMSNNLAQLVKSVMDKPTRNQLGGMNQGPPGGANPNHTHVVQLIQLAISNGFLNPQVCCKVVQLVYSTNVLCSCVGVEPATV